MTRWTNGNGGARHGLCRAKKGSHIRRTLCISSCAALASFRQRSPLLPGPGDRARAFCRTELSSPAAIRLPERRYGCQINSVVLFSGQNTKRASHGLDFDGSRTFKWDGSKRSKYIQSKKEKQQLSISGSRGRGAGAAGVDAMGSMVLGSWQPPPEPPGRPLPVHASGIPGGAGGMFHQNPWNALQGLGPSHHAHYGAPPHMHVQQHPHSQHAGYPAAAPGAASTPRSTANMGGPDRGDDLMRLMSPGATAGRMQPTESALLSQ